MRGDVKLTKLLQKPVPSQTGSEESHRSFNALPLICEAFVQCWGFVEKPGHRRSFQVLGGSITELSVTDVSQTAVRRCIKLDALCAQESIYFDVKL